MMKVAPMKIVLTPPMAAWIFLLCLLSPVHAAFTKLSCTPSGICVQRSPSGSICVNTNHTVPAWSCTNSTYQIPLEAHLGQHYAIGYYSSQGDLLGGWNYSMVAVTINPIIVCMSGRVNMTSEYLTLCAQTTADNSWYGGGCLVNVVPANVLDGCYAGVSVPFLFAASPL
jgi:hypothetical protein